jgi:hypothetical protein
MFATANSTADRPHLYDETSNWKQATVLADVHTINPDTRAAILHTLTDAQGVLRCTGLEQIGSSVIMSVSFVTYHALQRVLESLKNLSDVSLEFESAEADEEAMAA